MIIFSLLCFLILIDFGGNEMNAIFFGKGKVKNNVLFRAIRIVLIIIHVVMLCSITSCDLFARNIHTPSYLSQANIVFTTRDEELLCTGTSGYLVRMNFDAPNHYESCSFLDNGRILNYQDSVSIQGNLYVCLHNFENNNEYFVIKKYDNELVEQESIYFDNSRFIIEIECDSEFLYWTARDRKTSTITLERYSFYSKKVELVLDKIDTSQAYTSNHTRLFFNSNGSMNKYELKTKLIPEYTNGKRFLKTDCLELQADKGEIRISDSGKEFVFKDRDKNNAVYDKAYIIDDKLLFATYSYRNNTECAYSKTCVCSKNKSYLYTFNLESNELLLVDEFETGTFLIDYDFNSVAYYFNGGLYLNDALVRECEKVETGEIKRYGLFDSIEPLDAYRDYYLSFLNGVYYGI